MEVGKRINYKHYERVGIFELDDVLQFVFDKKFRKTFSKFGYDSTLWKKATNKVYNTSVGCVRVSMGSHRYQLFALKGVKCVNCGISGKYFALERAIKDKTSKFHFNLYGIGSNGHEVMMTKDHIIPRAKGGKNRMENYQPMCIRCNRKKADSYD